MILSSLLGSFLLLFGLHLLLLLVSIFFVLERVDVRVCADFKLGLASLFDVILVIEEIEVKPAVFLLRLFFPPNEGLSSREHVLQSSQFQLVFAPQEMVVGSFSKVEVAN